MTVRLADLAGKQPGFSRTTIIDDKFLVCLLECLYVSLSEWRAGYVGCILRKQDEMSGMHGTQGAKYIIIYLKFSVLFMCCSLKCYGCVTVLLSYR